ncbi:hypothetical protein VCRA2119O48_110128 [Vibrio crassostreae]|nr:hypothetical protein VCRA2119O48_110128 [Vibrio crassostreae]CAK3908852.1 hypothetical protein VCRA212O16_330069 [Vibrio crassostreae]
MVVAQSHTLILTPPPGAFSIKKSIEFTQITCLDMSEETVERIFM